MSRLPRSAVALGLALAAAGLGIGWSKCGEPPKAAESADSGALAPVPDALICDVYVATPNASWTKLQRGVGGAAGILPATFPGVVVAMSDLDPLISAELDGAAPMYGVVAGDPSSPTAALAIKVVDARRARALVFDGEAARFVPQESGGITHLVPKARPDERRTAAALTSNGYLLVGKRAADLERLGPYLSTTLPTRPLPTDAAAVIDVPRSALATVIKPKLEALWRDAKEFLLAEDARMRSERGRAPDFGDPAAIVAAADAFVARRVAVLGDLERIRVAIEVTDDSAAMTALLTPLAGDGPAKRWVDGMRLGDAAALLDLPLVSAFAVSTRDGDDDRALQGKELETALASSLGGRLKEPDAKRLRELVDDWTRARDEAIAASVTLDEPSGMFVRAPVRDADAAGRSLRAAVDLTRADPFKEILRVRDVSSTTAELPGLGKLTVATIAREPRKAPSPSFARADAGAPLRRSDDFGVAWEVQGGALVFAAGAEPVASFRTSARPDKRLGDEPQAARFARSLEASASTIVLAQPLRVDPKRANLPPAPLAISVGRRGNDAVVRVDVADGLLREGARWQMGF